MRSRITNDTGRRAGTSHKLSTFAILGEEEELMERKWQEAERLKEEQERREREREKIAQVENWADVEDDEDYLNPSPAQFNDKHSADEALAPEEEEEAEQSKQIFIDIKTQKPKTKAKKEAAKEDIDSLLAGLQESKSEPPTKPQETQQKAEPTEDRTKAVAQLRAKIAAAGNRNRKPAEEEGQEKKKKTKQQKKDAKRLYER